MDGHQIFPARSSTPGFKNPPYEVPGYAPESKRGAVPKTGKPRKRGSKFMLFGFLIMDTHYDSVFDFIIVGVTFLIFLATLNPVSVCKDSIRLSGNR